MTHDYDINLNITKQLPDELSIKVKETKKYICSKKNCNRPISTASGQVNEHWKMYHPEYITKRGSLGHRIGDVSIVYRTMHMYCINDNTLLCNIKSKFYIVLNFTVFLQKNL